MAIQYMFFLGGLFFFVSATAQPERIYVHFDKPFYLAGEIVHYKVWLLEPPQGIKSGVLYVEWTPPGAKTAQKQALKIKVNGAEGSFEIPYTTPDGYFGVSAYTERNLDYDPGFIFRKALPVYNDLLAPPAEKAVTEVSAIAKQPPIQARAGIRTLVTTDKTHYAPRDTVAMEIVVENENEKIGNANLSISIMEKGGWEDEIFPGEEARAVMERYQKLPNAPLGNEHETESGIRLQGMALNPLTGALVLDKHLGLYFIEDKQWRPVSTQQEKLNVELPEFYGDKTVQLVSFSPNYPLICRFNGINDKAKTAYTEVSDIKPPRTASVNRYLQRRGLLRKVESIFGAHTLSPFTSTPDASLKIDFDRRYWMKDYKNMETVEDFFREAVLISHKRELKQGKTIQLTNTDSEGNELYKFPPIYLVDDVFLEDEERILQIPLNEIERIDLLASKSNMTKQGLDLFITLRGIVSIHRKPGLPPFLPAGNKLFIVHGFLQPIPFVILQTDHRTPDFRAALYWNGSIRTDANGKARIVFPASDAAAGFNTRVVGVTDAGKVFETTGQNN